MKHFSLLLLSFIVLFAQDGSSSFERIQEQEQKFYKSIDDINDTDAQTIIQKKVKGQFGLKPFDDNYLLPISYREGTYTSYTPSDEYRNIEAEMQISLSYDIYTNVFGLDETYTLAYTQKSMWQIYTQSAPFRETNYNPEFLVSIPIYHNSEYLSIKMLRFSLSHQSNGQGNITTLDVNTSQASKNPDYEASWFENRSRSWNYATAMVVMQHKSLFIALRGWYRLPEDPETDDNPDLIDYLGHGELMLLHPYGKALARVKIRHNFKTSYGAVEGTLSYPFAHQENVYWYAKVFSGYGETLIDYNNYITKFAIGVSFSR